jgi:hypothetical protein
LAIAFTIALTQNNFEVANGNSIVVNVDIFSCGWGNSEVRYRPGKINGDMVSLRLMMLKPTYSFIFQPSKTYIGGLGLAIESAMTSLLRMVNSELVMLLS